VFELAQCYLHQILLLSSQSRFPESPLFVVTLIAHSEAMSCVRSLFLPFARHINSLHLKNFFLRKSLRLHCWDMRSWGGHRWFTRHNAATARFSSHALHKPPLLIVA
jgi:hypothetical protein